VTWLRDRATFSPLLVCRRCLTFSKATFFELDGRKLDITGLERHQSFGHTPSSGRKRSPVQAQRDEARRRFTESTGT